MSWKWLVIPAAIILGLVAETGWPPGTETQFVVADLATGWLFVVGGFMVWRFRPANRMGLLMMATGAAWFIATYYPPAAFLYCGPLAHLLAAHPTGRLAGRPSQIIVATVYVVSVVAAVFPIDGVEIAIGALLVAIGLIRLRESTHGFGRASVVTHLFNIVVGLVLVGASAVRMVGTGIDEPSLFVYQAVLAAIVLSIAAQVVWQASSPGVLTRIVVDLGGAAEAGTLRDRLARAVVIHR